MPATFLLNYLFMGWLHKPELVFIEMSATRNTAAHSSGLSTGTGNTSTDEDSDNDNDDDDGIDDVETLPAEVAIGPHSHLSAAVHRRPVHQASRVYAFALVVGLLCLLLIASVTRLFTPELTVEWLKVTSLTFVDRCSHHYLCLIVPCLRVRRRRHPWD